MSEPRTEMTAEETFESLNGYEEIAIAKHFGKEITVLAEHHPTTFTRALVFAVETRRGDVKAEEAKETAMRLTLAEATGYFTPDPEDLDPDDPESASGKDASPGEGPQQT